MVSLLGLLICISLVLIVTNHLVYSSTQSSLLQVSQGTEYFDQGLLKSLLSPGSHPRRVHSDVPATCHFDDQMLS